MYKGKCSKQHVISENIRVSELCIKGSAAKDAKIWTPHLYTLFEELFNQLNSKYLVLFFLPDESRRYLSFLPDNLQGNLSSKLMFSEVI